MTLKAAPKSLIRVAPFAYLGLVALALLRPPPVFPPPAQSRVDGGGKKVVIPLPFRASVIFGGSEYLETTHAPETLYKADGPRPVNHLPLAS
jgi:hypothetical protein